MKTFLAKYIWVLIAVVVAAAMLIAAGAYALSQGGPQKHDARVELQQGLADYTWNELAAIADEIGACGDEAEAFRTAARFGLCDEGGSPVAGQTKEVVLADGRTVHAQLAGIWHDVRADGGRAGLTFVFAEAAGAHAMNHAFEDARGDAPDSVGGWSASDMRAWLDGDFFYDLPSDLRNGIVAVEKSTVNRADTAAELDEAGHLAGARADWADVTADRVWLLSASEVCGAIPESDALGIDDTMAALYAGEGAQYRLFADVGIAAFEPNDALVRSDAAAAGPCTWWLRTKTLEFGDGFWLVGTDGAPINGLGEDARAAQDPEYAPSELWGPDHARGVVAGFCL